MLLVPSVRACGRAGVCVGGWAAVHVCMACMCAVDAWVRCLIVQHGVRELIVVQLVRQHARDLREDDRPLCMTLYI